MTNLGTAADGVVRYISNAKVDLDGHCIPVFERAVLERIGVTTSNDAAELYYRPDPLSREPLFPRYPADIAAKMPPQFFENKIVLIGGDLVLEDRHLTPFIVTKGPYAGSMPGVVIDAHAIAQLLEHLGVRHLPFYFALLGTVLFVLLDSILISATTAVWLRYLISLGLSFGYLIAVFEVYLQTLLVLPLIAPILAPYIAHSLSRLLRA
jgi:CHASE2 domain-containing sensor protein